ncbi:tetratricopeptide repeat protein [Coraliomargarita sp. W4R53]
MKYVNRTFRALAWGMCVALSGASLAQAAVPFQLTDSSPGSAEFRARFLANYGTLSELEPSMTAKDRPLFERVEPYLKNNPQQAIREVEAALNADSNPAFRFLLGSLYYQTSRYGQAEQNLRMAVKAFPDFRRAYRTLGLIYVQTNRYPEAITAWLKVISLGGGDAQSYGLLGYAYLTESKYQSALSAYQMARMFKPDSVDFRRGEAQSLLETSQYRQAAALFEELIAEQPTVADMWLLQANTFLQLERYDDAIANLEVVHGMGAGTRDSRFLLGNLYLRAENYRPALQAYQAGLTQPGELDVAQAMQPLEYLIGRGLIAEAREYLQSMQQRLPAELSPEQTDLLALAEAKIERRSENSEAALALLKPLVERNPLQGEALLLIAEIELEAERFEEAVFYLERAKSVPEKQVDALIAMGRLEVNRDDFEAALKYLREAQQIKPQPQIARYIRSIEQAL